MKRKEARQIGLIRYQPDSPCLNCGTSERYTSTGSCVVCHLRKMKEGMPNPKLLRDVVTMPSTQAEAIRLGCKYFMPDHRCKHGHLVKRRTRTGACTLCERLSAAQSATSGRASALQRAGLVMLSLSVRPEHEQAIRDFAEALAINHRLLNPVKPPVLPPVPLPAQREIDPRN